MRNFSTLLILFSFVVLSGCARHVPTKTALELQAIQAKEFESTKKAAFASTISVFQDLGYVINSANLETGLITGKSPTKQSVQFFVGQVMTDVKATAFVEEITPGRTKIRLNFVASKETSNEYGMKGGEDSPIEDSGMYQDVFIKIQQGIFIRKNVH